MSKKIQIRKKSFLKSWKEELMKKKVSFNLK